MYNVTDNIRIENTEMRMVFAKVMYEMAEEDQRLIYLDSDLINSIGMTDFWRQKKAQTINCGIQEANMIGVAAGLSAVGLIPFTHTFASFASRRVMDQIFVSGAYAKQNIKMIGSDPGIAATTNGGTHMSLEDIGIMRSIPNVTIIEPTDTTMLNDILRKVKDEYGIYYIRLFRKKTDKIYEENSTFTIGEMVTLRDGEDATIIASGIMVSESLRAADILSNEGIRVTVIDCFTIKPIDKECIMAAAKKTGAIVTVENHNVTNGLGSAVAEVLCENMYCPLERVGIIDTFGEVGSIEYLKGRFKISKEDIVTSVKKAILRKAEKYESCCN